MRSTTQKKPQMLPKLLIGLLLMSFTANQGVADGIHSRNLGDFRPLPSIRLTCEDVLQKCDAALEARKKQVEKLELGLAKQTERVADLTGQLEEKNQQLQSWYRNPFVVFSIGLVAGAAVITFAK